MPTKNEIACNVFCLAAGLKPDFPKVKLEGTLLPTTDRTRIAAMLAKQEYFDKVSADTIHGWITRSAPTFGLDVAPRPRARRVTKSAPPKGAAKPKKSAKRKVVDDDGMLG